jgi:hypothetical protein
LNQIQQYFQSNNIKSITLKDKGELLIEYQQGNNETASADSSELQQIQTYCQQKNLKTLDFNNLQNQQGNKQLTNYYILGGIVLIAVIVIIGVIYWVNKNKKNGEGWKKN